MRRSKTLKMFSTTIIGGWGLQNCSVTYIPLMVFPQWFPECFLMLQNPALESPPEASNPPSFHASPAAP